MKISIDLTKCLEYNMDYGEYVTLVLLYLGKRKDLSLFSKDEWIESLISKGYAHFQVNHELCITALGVAVLEDKKDLEKLQEFLGIYPKRVGSRSLLPTIKGKRKYLQWIAEDLSNHITAMKGLTNHIEARKQADKKGEFFDEWQNCDVYINQMTWDKYLDYEPEEDYTTNETTI